MRRRIENIWIHLALLLGIMACTPEPIVEPNPFDRYREVGNLLVNDSVNLPQGSFAQLHRDIFQPTCANAGCHDGHFEPDFRSIESSYNTLVYQPMIKNDAAGTYDYRVLPYELDASVLWNRLNTDIDGQSGIMPLVVDPDDDWTERREEYLRNVRLWIESGAPDVFGNIPSQEGLNPFIQGLVGARTIWRDPYKREKGTGSILVPETLYQLQLWASIRDDDHIPEELKGKLYLSTKVDELQEINGVPLKTFDERVEIGFDGTEVLHSHRMDVRVDTFAMGERVFMHLKILDPDSGEFIRIPSIDSPDYIKELFSFKRF